MFACANALSATPIAKPATAIIKTFEHSEPILLIISIGSTYRQPENWSRWNEDAEASVGSREVFHAEIAAKTLAHSLPRA
jgi:hypothetical protein